MRVLVCGSRHAKDPGPIRARLNKIRHKIDFLVTGDASGVDSFAAAWAREWGIAHAIFPACWEYYGREAGPVRNVWMAIQVVPDLVLAFKGGAGTANMVKVATVQEIEVELVEDDD